MTTERSMKAVGITLGLAVAVLLTGDAMSDNDLSRASRLLVIAIAGITFGWVTIRQILIARKYEGWPVALPLAFRWVVAVWFGALALLVGWIVLITIAPDLYTTSRSTVIWLIFAETTIFFLTRWISVGRPQLAGPGETGANQ